MEKHIALTKIYDYNLRECISLLAQTKVKINV